MARYRFLIPVLFLLATLPLSAAIAGRVLDEDGKPLRGVRVRARVLETPDQNYARVLSNDPMPQWFATAETNESGVFQIDSKSNPVFELMIDAPGRQLLGQDVLDGEDAGTFVLRKAPTRRGRVTASGKPVVGAVVIIGRSYLTRTNEEGYFESPEPIPQLDRIQVIHPDYAIVDRSLRPDRSREEMLFDVGLKPGTAIRGRVVDPAGRAVAGAVVRALSWPLARSSEDGSFEIAHAPSEKPSLYAREGNRVGTLFLDRTKPPYVITLRPAATVSGTVRSSKDETPVPGARVMVRGDFSEGWTPSVISDAKGNYAVEGIDAGTRRIFASHPAFSSNSAELRLEEGARVNRVVTLTPYARISGKVIDDEQKPVAAASVGTAAMSIGAKTAPDGSFSVRIPVFESMRGWPVMVSRKDFALATFGPYTLEPGESKSGLVYRITRGNRIEIRLADRDGVAFAREPITLSRKTDSRFPLPVPCGSGTTGQECRSDAEGRIVYQIADGAYDVSAGGDATVKRLLPNQTLNARSSPLVIELERGAVIEGRVVWSDGTPATIPATVATTTNPPATVQVTDGAFVLRSVPAGKVTLIVDAVPPASLQSEPVEVTAPASGVTLKLPRFGRIEGRVVDRETEKGVRDFTIMLQQTGGHPRPMAPRPFRTEDGRFVIEDIAPGMWDLRVQAAGYSRNNANPVTVEEAKTASASVALDRGGTVVGRVTGEGRALADAQVMIPFDPGMRSMSYSPTTTDGNGEFTLDGLLNGSVRIEARHSGYAPGSVTVTVAAGKETRAEIDLSRGRELRGRVVDPSGRPVAQADIMTRGAPGGMGFGMTTSDAEGNFKLSGLADRTYTLVARKDGFAEGTADVNPATSNDVTIALTRGGTVSGRILGVAAADLPFVDVRSIRSPNRTQPDASGAYTLTGVPDGDVTIFASLTRPRPRNVQVNVKVVNGMAPPVDLDFGAGVAVRGRVTQGGRLIQGHISFMPVARPAMPGTAIASGEIGRDGTYEVRVPEPGEYEVSVNRYGTPMSIKTGRVNVTGEMVHDVELRGATVSGVVLDAATREPVPNAEVSIQQMGASTRTNGAGRFSFELIGDGKYQLRVQDEGYAPAVRALEIANGAPADVEVMLSRGVAAMLRVLDAATGAPIEFASISILDSVTKLPVYSGTPAAEANGMRRFTLQPGTYLVFVYSNGYASLTKPLTLTVPGPPLDVRLERPPQP